jgi:hypothetical protein
VTKVSGKDLISSSTEKTIQRLIVVSGIAIISKLYSVPVGQLRFAGIDFPPSVFDVSILLIIVSLTYSFLIKWMGDLAAFRLWFNDSSIWSQFGTNMKLDGEFISGGVELLKKLYAMQNAEKFPTTAGGFDTKTLEEAKNLETNLELWGVRLDYAGRKFKTLSAFGHYYVWIQNFAFPLCLAAFSIYLLLKFGEFKFPKHL